MKGELTTTEHRVSVGCGNVPGGEDGRAQAAFGRCRVSPLAPQQADAGRLQP